VYGFASVAIGTILARRGVSAARAGLLFTAMLAGNALATVMVARLGDRAGRRRVYGALYLLMAGASLPFALTTRLPVLIVCALSGTLSTDPNESGPLTSLEQAMAGSAPAAERPRVFGRYNAVAYAA